MFKYCTKLKDSEVEYIGSIPESWKLIRNKHIFKKNKVIVGPKWDEYNVLSLTKKGVIIKDIELNEGKMPSDFSIYQIVHPDNLLMCLFDIDVTPRCVGYIGNKGIVSAAYTELSAKDTIHMKYYYWWYLMLDIDKQLLHLSKNLRNSLSTEDFMALSVVKPPLVEQQQIANYLDEQTAKIDATIVKNEELIQLLEEKRVALINQVVTKGLNPDAPMKDSGVKWIGEIPEHWEIKRLKYNCNINPSNKKSVSDGDLKINFLPMDKVSEDGWYDIDSFASYSSISKGYTYFENNDVLVAKITPCFENGKSALLKDLKYGFGFGSTEFHVLRFKEHILPEFIYYLIKSYAFRTIGQAFMHGTAGQKRVGSDFIENYLMVTPPIDEQKEIVKYLDNEITKITLTISKIQESIILLEEYKTSLIHHVVTGKIDVRGEEI